MKSRTVTIIVCLLDTMVWLGVAFAMFSSGSDPATKGLDQAAGIAVTILFILTGAAALALILLRWAPRTALTLALAFPALLALLFVAAVVGYG